MAKKMTLCLLIMSALGSMAFATGPLTVSTNGRYLQSGATPVFLNGDAAYSMIGQLTYAQADQYLTDRAGRGVNVVIVSLIEHYFSTNAPKNIYGVPPFTGAVFTTPNPAYFALADSIISRADALGITILLFPLYLGDPFFQGYGQEVFDASPAAMRSWGQYVGNRYRNFPNIIWVIGGDFGSAPLNATIKSQLDTFAVALKTTDTVYPRLMTGHGARGQVASKLFTSSWLNLNNVYSGATATDHVTLANTAYSVTPVLPFFNIEANYEHEIGSDQVVRAQAYWTILRGGCGYVFGNCPIWGFSSPNTTANCASFGTWQSNLGSPDSQDMTRVKDLFTSRHWWGMIPDNGTVLTSGASSGADLATFASAADGSAILGYLPSRRAITINPLTIAAPQIHAQWYNPTTGAYTEIGTFDLGSRSYTPPSSGDWVLVLDGAGSTTGPPAVPIPLTPANSASGVELTPTLTWNASNGATSYEVQVSADPAFGTTLFDQIGLTNTMAPVSGLANNASYYWRVSATNGNGTSAYSPTWSFTTLLLVAVPAAPTLNVPALGAIGISMNPTLNWSASTGAVSYRVQVSSDASFGVTIIDQNNVAATSLAISALAANSTFYWRVSASNGAGTSAYSSVWSFTTLTVVAAPPPPVLATPADSASGISIRPTLTWNAAASAASYRVQVSASSGFGTLLVDRSNVTVTSLSISSLANSTTYFWHVSASNSGGTSLYSSTNRFTTQMSAPSAPTLASPSNGATGVTTNPTLTWNPSTNAATYRMQLSTSSSFSPSTVDQSGLIGTSFAVTGLRTSTTYYWRVNASNAGGTSAYSGRRSFRTGRRQSVGAGEISVTSGSSSDGAVPSGFSLGQNYPNPFNPTTRIEFAVPEASQVTLEVFNVLGQSVRTLVNSRMEAGYHSVQWDGTREDGSSVSSGIYLYRLTTSDYIDTKKMILLK